VLILNTNLSQITFFQQPLKRFELLGGRWLKPIILIRRQRSKGLWFKVSPQANCLQDPIKKKIHHDAGLVEWLQVVEHLLGGHKAMKTAIKKQVFSPW
jgi:hypothetical protein